MIIAAGVPLIVTTEGLRERLDQPADTETRLYWEMQLDRGDAVLVPLDEPTESGYTHRLVSETGGSFHVRVQPGGHQWPELSIPPALGALVTMVEELARLRRQMQTLLAANQELEARLNRLSQIADEDLHPGYVEQLRKDGLL